MASKYCNKGIELLKKTTISVFVDEALPDILVVTYEFGVRIFKGVLLDSTKRNLPCGIQTLNPALKAPDKKPPDDPLYAVNQRYAYTDPIQKKKNMQMANKYKNNKMTVRLRPRKVLCSKCKGICNENSENVSRKRKNTEIQRAPPIKRGLNAPVTRSVSDLDKLGKASLVPRLTRLTPQEEKYAMDGETIDKIFSLDNNKKLTVPAAVNSNDKENSLLNNSPPSIITKSANRILRKKPSIGSMEDLWDESVFEENVKNNNSNAHSDANDQIVNTTNTRTIKISYGPQGEGTVLKIPATIDQDEKVPEQNKAARKALKRAKKEARRKIFLTTGGSPCYLGGASPRYGFGGSSPRYTVGSASPRQGLGGLSPRYICTPNEGAPRRRKHKMKHKKKHKDEKERKHKEGEVSSTQSDADPKDTITQKLSINLKRLTNLKYTPYPNQSGKPPSEETSSSSDEHSSEQVPNFPPANQMLRMNSQSVSSAPTSDGGRMSVGDVVWGKIHGFPWWPGKVLTITNCGAQGAPQAHVSWYGSSTSSLMQCDQLSPYLENFKIRYNKKKRGPYKEAIKQATFDARNNAESRMRQPLSSSPSHFIPPPLASPRQIDVLS